MGITPSHQHRVQLFPSSSLLELMVIDSHDLLLCTKSDSQLIVVISNRNSRMTRAIPSQLLTMTLVANKFFKYGLSHYLMSDSILFDNGRKIISQCFASKCIYLDVKEVTTTAYHPKTNVQMKIYNSTLVKRLQLYMVDNKQNWVTLVQPFNY